MIFTIKDKRILHIHIPKCAGTSIEWALNSLDESGHPVDLNNHDRGVKARLWGQVGDQQLQHLTPREIEARGIPLSSFDYVFTVIRKPFDRIMSELNWQACINRENRVDVMLDQLEADRPNKFCHDRLQYEYLDGLSEDLGHDIWRLDQLDDLAEDFHRWLGLHIEWPVRMEAWDRRITPNTLTPAQLERVHILAGKDWHYIKRYFES